MCKSTIHKTLDCNALFYRAILSCTKIDDVSISTNVRKNLRKKGPKFSLCTLVAQSDCAMRPTFKIL